MPHKIDLTELLKNNPAVDVEELNRGLKLAEELRRVRPVGIGRRSGVARRRVRIIDDLQSDPRVTRLSSLRLDRSK